MAENVTATQENTNWQIWVQRKSLNETALGPHIYQKGPPNRGGVGHAGVGWVMQGWGGLYSGGVGCENFH